MKGARKEPGKKSQERTFRRLIVSSSLLSSGPDFLDLVLVFSFVPLPFSFVLDLRSRFGGSSIKTDSSESLFYRSSVRDGSGGARN